jgi:RNA polymerase sigma factor (sigma-70 family)
LRPLATARSTWYVAKLVELAFERPERQEDVRTLHPSPPQPDALLDDKELQQRVSAAIASLPERARLVMELRWRAGLTYAEVADAMGISIKGSRIN